MATSGGITLFHIRGIRIAIDWSWFLVLFLAIFFLSDFYRDLLDAPEDDIQPYLLAVISALLFFGSILLHELGHAAVAVRNGIGITQITLWMFGGVAALQRDSDSAGTEFKIAIAGPAVTLAIAALCGAIGTAVGSDFWGTVLFDTDSDSSAALAVVAWLANVNLLILVFNLIPAYPLDGGRIARSIAWKVSGNRTRATRFAATLGQGFSWAFIGLGIAMLIFADAIAGIWLALIGWILGQSARGAAAQTEVSQRLEGVTVADVMDREPVAISENASVQQALDEYFLRYRWPWFPVVDAAQRFLGLINRGAADSVPEPRRASARVAEVFDVDRAGALQVRDDAPLEELLGDQKLRDELRRLEALAVVDAGGRLSGVISLDDVGRALRDTVPRPPA